MAGKLLTFWTSDSPTLQTATILWNKKVRIQNFI